MKTLYTLTLLVSLLSVSQAQFCTGIRTLTECSGEFDDGSGDSNYANGTNCGWIIRVPEDSVILLVFNSFETESCCDDLRVYNGASSNAPLIGEYAGSTVPNFIQSATNELFLEFTTDGSATDPGWSVSYTCNNLSFVDLTYGQVNFNRLLDFEGSVMEYEFTIRNNGSVDSGPFEVGFYASEDTEIETSDELMYTVSVDSVAANGSLLLTGIVDVRDSVPPGEYNVGIIIDYQQDVEELTEANNSYREISEQAYIPYCSALTTITGCEGTIEDGSGVQNIVRQTNCSWLVQSDNNESILLDFPSVNLLSSNASIRIYDGIDAEGTLIREFRGNEDFYPVVSTGTSIYFEFNSSFSSSAGWEAEYACTDTSISNLIMGITSDADSEGSVIEFDLNIQNNGNTPSPESKIYFFGSSDNAFNINGDFLIDSVELPSIEAFATLQVNHVVEARGALPPGEYRPVAVIDAFDAIAELNEDDNLEIFFDQFSIPYCPDTTTIINDCSGILTDGSGAADFTPGTDCSWLLTAPTDQFISLDQITGDLGSFSTVLRFYDGNSNFSPLIAQFQGSDDEDLPSHIVSSTENLYIEFQTSDFSTFGTGWSTRYSCEEEALSNLDPVDIDIFVSSFNNTVDYRFDVRNLGNVATAATVIHFILSPDQQVNANDVVVDSITLSALQPYQSVNIDYDLDLANLGIEGLGGNYYAGFLIDPSNEVMELNENDNDIIGDRIISVPYCTNESEVITDCDGELTDGSNSNNYANNSECSWIIQGPQGSNVRLNFTSFETESCCDFVNIYDGNSANSELLGRFSGTSLPPSIQTSQPNAFILFDTDGSSARAGWTLEYECIEFFSNLTFKNGSTQTQIVNNTLNFAGVIENDGVLPSGDFRVGVVFSKDQTPTLTDFLVQAESITSIGPGKERNLLLEVDLSTLTVPPGDYFLIVILDVDRSVEENDEMDNDFVSAFPIDILISSEDLSSAADLNVFTTGQDIFIKNELKHHINRLSLVQTNGVLLADRIVDNASPEYRIDALDYPAGIYFLRIELDDQVIVKKVFVP